MDHRRAQLWSILAVLGASACAHRQTGAGDGERPVLAAVDIQGNGAFDDEEILSGLATQPTGRWPWSDTRRLDRLSLAADERRVETFYALRGYYGARATTEVHRLGPDRVEVIIRVEEGPPTRVEAVQVTGLEGLPEGVAARVRDELPVEPGHVIRVADHDRARALLQERLRVAGYAAAEVEGRIDVYPERTAARVTFTASPGALHRYGDIEVEGLAAIPEEPVRRIARRYLARGKTYRPADVQAAESRLFELGPFRNVRSAVEAPAPGDGLSRIVLRVAERPVHSLSLGAGLGVDRTAQQVQLIVGYGNTDFLGGARQLRWRNELAFRYLPTFLEPERKGTSVETSLELTHPEVLPRTDLAVRGGYELVFREAFEAHTLTARASLGFRPSRALLLSPALHHERYLSFQPRVDVAPATIPLRVGCPEPCQLSFLSVTAMLDHRDDRLNPRRGLLVLGEVQYGAPAPLGTFSFVRIFPEVRYYVPLSRRLSLASRAVLGALFPLHGQESVMPARFFGGGQGGHRGFGADQLSPVVADGEGGVVPIGGEGLWLTSLELRWRASDRWQIVPFADFGDVTVEPLQIDPATAHLALGLGARLLTLAGPVRLDVAYRLPRRPRVALDTGVRGETEGLDFFTFFLSLGQAF